MSADTASPHGIGVVGLGVISRVYLDTLTAHAGVRIVAVADLDTERAATIAAGLPGVRAMSVDELVAHPDVDTVLNLTIPAAHAEVALAAIAHGKQVYGEKPLATTLEDAMRIVRAAADAGVRVGSAPDTVLGTGVQTARAAVDAGEIGQPMAAVATMVTPGHEAWHPAPDFYYQPGGGPLLDMGPYYVTSLVQVLGPVVSVVGASSALRTTRTVATGPRAGTSVPVATPTHVTGVLEHANGALSTIVTSFDAVATTAAPIEVHGATGTLRLPDPNGFDGDVALRRLGSTDWQVLPPSAGYVDGARGLGLLDFVGAIGDGAGPRATGDVALHVLDVMTAMLRSAVEGRRIGLTTTTARPPLVPLTAPERWRD